jgi:hypothetical protein
LGSKGFNAVTDLERLKELGEKASIRNRLLAGGKQLWMRIRFFVWMGLAALAFACISFFCVILPSLLQPPFPPPLPAAALVDPAVMLNPTYDSWGYGEIVQVPWESGTSTRRESKMIPLAFLYCWHVGDKAAQQWLQTQRQSEGDHTGSARPLNAKLRQYREPRCIGLGESAKATSREWPPLWARLMDDTDDSTA